MSTLAELRAEAKAHHDAIVALTEPDDDGNTPELSEEQRDEINKRNGLIEELNAKIKDAETMKRLRETAMAAAKDLTEAGRFMSGGFSKPSAQAKNGPGRSAAEMFTMCVQAAVVGKQDGRSPYDVAEHMYGSRFVHEIKAAQVGADAAAGGFLIPPGFVNDFVELLRPVSLIRRAGANVLTISGPTPIPGLATGTTGTWIAEGSHANESAVTFDQRMLTPKECMSLVSASNKLLRSSQPGALGLLQQDLVQGIAYAEEQAFLLGQGTVGTPRGVRYWAEDVTNSGGAWSTLSNLTGDLKGLRTRMLADLSGNVVRPVWLMRDDAKIEIGDKRNATTEALIFPTVEGESTLYGFPIFTSYHVPADEVYFVDMNDAVIGQEMSVQVDTSDSAAFYNTAGTLTGAFSKNLTVIRAITSVDFIMRRSESAQVLDGVSFT